MDARCPICQATVELSANNAFRPFCSERCKLLDLGRWFDEAYVIPGPPVEVEDDEFPTPGER